MAAFHVSTFSFYDADRCGFWLDLQDQNFRIVMLLPFDRTNMISLDKAWQSSGDDSLRQAL